MGSVGVLIMKVVLFAGPVCAGKTTIARCLADHIPGAIQASFSDGLRMLAKNDNISLLNRSDFQDYGEKVAQYRWRELLDATRECVQASSNQLLLLDGLRHPHILEHIRRFSVKSILIYVDPGPTVLQLRRRDNCEEHTSFYHASESHLSDLEAMSDLVIRGPLASIEYCRFLSRLIISYFSH